MTILIAIMLTILCTCSLLTAAATAMIAYMLVRSTVEAKSAPQEAPTASSPYTKEQMERMRKRSEDEIKAFQELMNYNVDVAYGIKRGENDE